MSAPLLSVTNLEVRYGDLIGVADVSLTGAVLDGVVADPEARAGLRAALAARDLAGWLVEGRDAPALPRARGRQQHERGRPPVQAPPFGQIARKIRRGVQIPVGPYN